MKPILLSATLSASICAAGFAQQANPDVSDLLNTTRSLSAAEVRRVMDVTRRRADGKTFRLSYGTGAPVAHVVMGPAGRPRFVQTSSSPHGTGGIAGVTLSGNGNLSTDGSQRVDGAPVTTLTEYTGTTARRCDGNQMRDELLIEYEQRGSGATWTARARTRGAQEFAARLFDVLAGDIVVESGEVASVGGSSARAFTTTDGHESLWIDSRSVLPIRWTMSFPAIGVGPAVPPLTVNIVAESSVSVGLRTPTGIAKPTCVS
jgi:hypothetical protein